MEKSGYFIRSYLSWYLGLYRLTPARPFDHDIGFRSLIDLHARPWGINWAINIREKKQAFVKVWNTFSFCRRIQDVGIKVCPFCTFTSEQVYESVAADMVGLGIFSDYVWCRAKVSVAGLRHLQC